MTQAWLWATAFVFGCAGFRRCDPSRRDSLRFFAGLLAGAALGHVGFLLFHWELLGGRPAVWIMPMGFSVLPVPLGLVLSMWRAPATRRAQAFAALPGALAIARVGCLLEGCCRGHSAVPVWAPAAVEITGLAILHRLAARLGRSLPGLVSVPGAVMLGFGLVRLATEPLRADPPLGAPGFPPAGLAAAWCIFGSAGLLRAIRGHPGRTRAGSLSSTRLPDGTP